TYRHTRGSENLRRRFAFIDRRIGLLSGAGGEENPLLYRCAELCVRYHYETTAAFCLPRFSAPERCAGGVREQDGLSSRRAGGHQQGDRVQKRRHLSVFIRTASQWYF